MYHRRRDVMVEAFGRAGWDIPPPPASMFAWAPLPAALKDMRSPSFARLRSSSIEPSPTISPR